MSYVIYFAYILLRSAAFVSLQTSSSPSKTPSLFDTRSVLHLVSSPAVHEAVLECRSSVPSLPDHALKTNVTLDVLCKQR